MTEQYKILKSFLFICFTSSLFFSTIGMRAGTFCAVPRSFSVTFSLSEQTQLCVLICFQATSKKLDQSFVSLSTNKNTVPATLSDADRTISPFSLLVSFCARYTDFGDISSTWKPCDLQPTTLKTLGPQSIDRKSNLFYLRVD